MGEKTKQCGRCDCFMNYAEDFCPECGIENFNAPDFSKSRTSKESQSIGGWVLKQGAKETNPPLYTRTCADLIKHKATGKKYKRGEYKLFWTSRGEAVPTFIEDTHEYEFYSNAQFPFGLQKYEPQKKN